MAAKTQWWKDGDHDAVVSYAAKGKKHDLCTECGQAFGVHGKVGNVLVHPGDFVVTLDGGKHEIEHPDPMAEALEVVTDA
jgi:hypothetical protein